MGKKNPTKVKQTMWALNTGALLGYQQLVSKTHDCQTVNSRNRLLLVYQLFSLCVFNQREYTWAILFTTVGSACAFSEAKAKLHHA